MRKSISNFRKKILLKQTGQGGYDRRDSTFAQDKTNLIDLSNQARNKTML